MKNNSLNRFRIVSFLEGLSFVFLVFIAMPLKYWAGMPLFVKYTGWAHGLLFVLFFISLGQVYMDRDWNWKKAMWCILASFVPFGTFVLEAKILRKEIQ